MLTLNIPQRRDPIARLTLLACAALVVYAAFVSMTAPQQASAQSEDIILIATPALPTPALSELPGVAAVPTPTAALDMNPTTAPGWIDQALAVADTASDQFAHDQAAALAAEQAAAAEKAAADRARYLATIGAQAPHSPRGDVVNPPAYSTGPVLNPATDDQPAMIIDPNIPAPDPQLAAAVPAISADQAAVLAQRESNGCAAGQVFYPRSGCHTPGSGGDMPGAVRP